MRIIQIIDSLEAGGAERMAVNYANALVGEITYSGLVVTRKEGNLKKEVDNRVSYLFLNKKNTFDVSALIRLRNFVKKNKVTVIHAHSTSFFIGVLIKLSFPKIKLVWHEHYGARINQSRMGNLSLLFSSVFFSSVLTVNPKLETWIKRNLFVKKVTHIPNFITQEAIVSRKTFLKGSNGRRIVCLANLKNPKNHLALLKVFEEMKLHDLDWSLHLIGKDYNDCYSDALKGFIKKNDLEKFIFIYDSKDDIQHILSQGTIGVLSSTDEGFPVSLLEYGLAKLAVLSTNVGYCPSIIKDDFSGLLFSPLSDLQFGEQLCKIISGETLRIRFGERLHEIVLQQYSREAVIKKYLNYLECNCK
ncbi:glycosyltransferase [Flavobacterium sp. W1B]|uniref:glycosyltransferase n=1 Tax=Flavobacterium sp. W1B TaxID=3394146 RepID=UPI0039BC8880